VAFGRRSELGRASIVVFLVMGQLARERLADLARQWADETCTEQDMPIKVEDVATLDSIGDLLSAAEEAA
jgi:hypothetical protein